jgi:hypothetical protein
MHQYFLIALILFYGVSCSMPASEKKDTDSTVTNGPISQHVPDEPVMPVTDSHEHNLPGDTLPDNEFYYIVVADTGTDYFILQQKMVALHQTLKLSIDTMERFYNVKKNLIALPEDHEDKIYAGSYFPRRFPSENLSLEYLHFYEEKFNEKTIALVTGIYETAGSADSALKVLRLQARQAFKIRSLVYVGCAH